MHGQIGVIGLAVMGRNLVLNIADHGTSVAVHNRTRSRLDDFIASPDAQARAIIGCATPGDLAAALEHPRAILLMVKAGRAVDDQIDALRPHLEPGDLIIDGGNAHYADTARRAETLADDGLLFLGAGISGGEEGARHGPAIMVGGDRTAYDVVAPVLRAIAADVGGDPCCAWFGPGGAGHFVKMVHNGIEYAVMQAIGEIWVMMRDLFRFDAEAAANTFSIWADGPLGSYLIEITANILATRDAETGRALVTMIADRAGHKGTGRWTGEAALALDVPAPTLIAGYLARCLSADDEARHEARLASPTSVDSYNGDRRQAAVEEMGAALRATSVIAYAEGFRLLKAASAEHHWDLDLAAVAAVWRGGCIVRARLLEDIAAAYRDAPDLALLSAAPGLAEILAETEAGWRRTVASAVSAGIPVPALSAALASHDSYRTPALWTSLVQAQRDYFGAHTYQRTDRDGDFHTDWTAGDGG